MGVVMCRWCYRRIYFTGVLYRLVGGSNSYVCWGAGSGGMHAR